MKKNIQTKKVILTIVTVCMVFAAIANTDRYRAVFNSDPSTTISISYCASDLLPDFTKIKIYYGTTDFGTNYLAYPNNKVTDRNTNYKDMRNGFFRLTGLQPKTRYYFVIVDANALVGGPHVSSRMFFETITNNADDRLSVISGGDSRVYQVPFDPSIINAVCGTEDARKRANRLVAKVRADVVWFNGDFTFSDNGPEWACWLRDWQLTISTDGRITPIVPAQGNHEVSLTVTGGSGAFADGNSINEILDCANPDNDNYYYALNFGGSLLRLYTLNSLISILGDQTDWLAADLQTNNCNFRWKLAQYHFPIRPHNSGKDEQDDQRAAWCPLFEQNHVQLAVESDAHLFKYTQAIRADAGTGSDEGFIKDTVKGTVYIGEGGWGAELRAADDNKDWTIASSSIFQFQLLFIDKTKIEIRTVLTDTESTVVAKTDADNKFTLPLGIALLNVPTIGEVYTLSNPHNKVTVNLGNDTLQCPNCSDTLDAGPGFASYAWSTGATTQKIIVNTPGTYSVVVTDRWNCSATDQITLFSTILPVKLLDFSGSIEDGNTKLYWKVAEQINVLKYVVEKSTDPVNGFISFDSVPPVVGGFLYCCIDKNKALSTVTYYRLKMVDTDGKFMLSPVILVYDGSYKYPVFTINPTMVSGSVLTVKIGYMTGKNGTITIAGASGETLLVQNVTLSETSVISLPVDISHLPAGMYYAILQQQDKRKWFKKFIKVNR